MLSRFVVLVVLLLFAAACTSAPVEPTATPAPPVVPPSLVPSPVVTPAAVPSSGPPDVTPTVRPSPPPTAAATSIAPTPAPTAVIPPRPAQVSDVPKALLAFLNAAPGNADLLKPLLGIWGFSTDALAYAAGSDVVMRGDIDGDGQTDLVVALGQSPPSSCETGAIVLYLAAGAGFRLGQQIGLLDQVPIDPRISHIPCPTIFVVRDLIHDGRSQVVFTSTSCGAHTCNVTVGVLRWESGDFRPVMAEPLPVMAYPEITIEANTLGGQDIVMHGGIIGSVGAGPQRERREQYRWNGNRFVLVQRDYDPSNYLYFKVIDANTAMRQGDLPDAIALYHSALSDPSLELSGLHPNERVDLQAFSRFRLMVAYVLSQNSTQAHIQLDALAAAKPPHIYYEVANTFWTAYDSSHSIAQACAAVAALGRANSAITAVLSDFGYANPDLAPEDVCQ